MTRQELKSYEAAHGTIEEDLANIIKDCIAEGMTRIEAQEYAVELQKTRIESVMNK